MRVSHGRLAIFALLLQVVFAGSALEQANNATSKRVVYYMQNMFGDNTTYISLLPLISEGNLTKHGKPFTTDVLIGAFHLGPERDLTQIHLNDLPPNNSIYDPLWNETRILQSKGININLFLGGAGDKSFQNLVSNWSYWYPTLNQTLRTYNFSGIDLDVEDGTETTQQMETLITQLRSDFGQQFVITLAPVASDLMGAGGLSLIDYKQLYQDVGSNISWFNVQFYSGFGSLSSTFDYMTIVNNSFPANKVVAGMLSNSANGAGFVDIPTVEKTVKSLVKEFRHFGGVATWEYFNALPGGTSNPAEWGTVLGKAMGVH